MSKIVFYILVSIATFLYICINNVKADGFDEYTGLGEEKKLLMMNAAHVSEMKWTLGVVPYYLDKSSYDELIAQRLRVVMNLLEDSSCIRFYALTEPNYITTWLHITNPNKIRECVHYDSNHTTVERTLTLGYECLQRWEILHTLMHGIGFKDEVTHPQRNQYVRIIWENINPKYHSLFRIRFDDFSPINTEYDATSIMQFHDRAFTKNGQATIAPTIPGLLIDPTDELSPLDKMRLRLIFGHECNKRKVGDLLDSCKTAMSASKNNGPSVKDNYGTDTKGVQEKGFSKLTTKNTDTGKNYVDEEPKEDDAALNPDDDKESFNENEEEQDNADDKIKNKSFRRMRQWRGRV